MNHQYQITVGDWSGDGHSQSDTIVFNTNKSAEEIKKSYLTICKKTKISLTKVKDTITLFDGYDDNRIMEHDVETLQEAGVDLTQVDADGEGGDLIFYDPEAAFHLLMAMCKVNLPDLEYEIAKADRLELDDGFIGYGIYP